MLTHERIPPAINPPAPKGKLHLNSPNTFYGEPFTSPLTHDIHTQNDGAQFEERYHFINNTYRPITLMKRDGFCTSIGHTDSLVSKDFIIRRTLRLKHSALFSAIASLSQQSGVQESELSEIQKCLSSVASSAYTEASLMLDYRITVEDLQARGGTLYHQQLDLVLSLSDVLQIDAHPYSTRFMNIGSFGHTEDYTNQNELNIKIRLVDHSNVATPRFFNLGGKVFKLLPQKDAPHRRITSQAGGKIVEKTYPDYVQVFYSAKHDTSVINNEGVGILKMTLGEAEETLGLCKNIHDATNPGRIDAERKREIIALAHSLELKKSENQLERATLEREDSQRKEELSRQNHELELAKSATQRLKQDTEILNAKLQLELSSAKQLQTQLDVDLLRLENDKRVLEIQRKAQDDLLERERREFEARTSRLREEQEARIRQESQYWKEFYEMRAAQRKDTSDFVKFIPGLILGISGMAAVYLKFSPTTKTA